VLLAGVSALAIMLGAGGARPDTIAFTGAEVTWTVPVTGLYDLTAYGARGGGFGGYGAEIGGDIELSAGTVLSVVVGGRGGTAGASAGGGGGAAASSSTETRCLWRLAAAAAMEVTLPLAGQGSRPLRAARVPRPRATSAILRWLAVGMAERVAREAKSGPLWQRN
jgi:hypothetical protein